MILQGEFEKTSHIYYEYDKASHPIGRGGMGTVYKGQMVDVSTGASRDVAIKEIQVDGTIAEQSLIIERARREASIRIKNDNLVEMLGFVEIEDNKLNHSKKRYYVISELLNGVTLDRVLEGDYCNYYGETIRYANELGRKYQMDREDTSCFIVKNVLSAIMALHDKGYLHRDIDPSNIMITDEGKIKLIDFGISKQIRDLTTSDNQKLNGSFVGKVEYASPEQILGDVSKQDITTDIYSVGVLFYKLLTGNLPFEGNRFEIVQGHLSKKPQLKCISSRQFKMILGKSLAKDQKKRYSSSAAMRSALDGPEPAPKPLLYIVSSVLITLFAFLIYEKTKQKPVTDEDSVRLDTVVSNMPPDLIVDDKQYIDVKSIIDSGIDVVWDELRKDPKNPVALFCVAEYYRNHRIDNNASQFWEILKKDGDVNRFLINDKTLSSLRLCFVTICRAKSNINDYKLSDHTVRDSINEMLKQMMSDVNNGGDNFRFQ